MVRPARFAFNEATATNNFFQRKRGRRGWRKEPWRSLTHVSLLRSNDVEVFVMQDTPEPSTPDAIFPNNWFSSHLTGSWSFIPCLPKTAVWRGSPICSIFYAGG